ncbi:MAG: efflux RND transporter permease subunit [Alphaproteobacteria bacterium]|nr:efflux RND transporter permease subunit [Alphaproteobacteria bacterium]
MNLTQLSLSRDRVAWTALLAVLIAGVMAYVSLPRAEDPGFTVRTAVVTTRFPGASPARVEQLITDRIEAEVQQIPQLDFVSSESRTGVSIVYVNIQESEAEMRPIWDDLRRKMDALAPQLPDGTIGPDVNDSFGDVFGVVLALTGEGYSYAELAEAADQVRDELLRLDQVAKVDLYGAQQEQILVEYSAARLAELGLSPYQLKSNLESQNILFPGGAVELGPERIALEPTGNFEDLDELRASLIRVPGQPHPIALEHIADVRRGYADPPRSLMRWSGQPALGLGVSLKQGGDILTLGADVEALLRRLQGVHPIGLDLHVVAFQPDIVDTKVDEFVVSLVQSVALVVGVMLIFLGLRTGLIVASLIPASMVATFLFMSLMGVGIDQISLAALIIALGMLVDNAVVMSESVLVRMQEGDSVAEASIASASELSTPLLVSSLTTAAAFLPIYLSESSSGEYTAPLFLVVTTALLCSWVMALTLIPLLCVAFLKGPEAGGEAYDTPFYQRYRAALLALLRRPWATLGGALGLLAMAIWGFGFLPSTFFPPSDRPLLAVDLELAPGTRIQETEATAARLEAFLDEALRVGEGRESGVTGYTGFIGGGAPRFVLTMSPKPGASSYAFYIVDTTDRAQVDAVKARLEAFVAEELPGVELRATALEMGPPIGKPIQLRLSGRDQDRLFELVDATKAHLAELPGTTAISDDWGARSKKLRVEVDQQRAQAAGLSSQDVAVSLQAALSGIEATQFREGGDALPVMLRTEAADRQDFGKLETLQVTAQSSGRSVPLSQVAELILAWEPGKIRRRDRFKTVTVEADLLPGVQVAPVIAAVTRWLDAEAEGWPLGYGYAVGGQEEKSAKSNAALMAKLPIAALLIVMLLVGQFNSIRRPLIVLLTLPLGLIGVTAGLLGAGSYFGFMTLLGIISLMGIIINNAVVLLDRVAVEIEEHGRAPAEAVVEAAQRRLRPILLTTSTTMVGLVPLWLGGGPMWEPMAISIIFGLGFATALTLGVVPVLYSLFFGVRYD